MKFLVTYPNGKSEVCTSEAETPEAYAMMHMGRTLEAYAALGGLIGVADEDTPPAGLAEGEAKAKEEAEAKAKEEAEAKAKEEAEAKAANL